MLPCCVWVVSLNVYLSVLSYFSTVLHLPVVKSSSFRNSYSDGAKDHETKKVWVRNGQAHLRRAVLLMLLIISVVLLLSWKRRGEKKNYNNTPRKVSTLSGKTYLNQFTCSCFYDFGIKICENCQRLFKSHASICLQNRLTYHPQSQRTESTLWPLCEQFNFNIKLSHTAATHFCLTGSAFCYTEHSFFLQFSRRGEKM